MKPMPVKKLGLKKRGQPVPAADAGADQADAGADQADAEADQATDDAEGLVSGDFGEISTNEHNTDSLERQEGKEEKQKSHRRRSDIMLRSSHYGQDKGFQDYLTDPLHEEDMKSTSWGEVCTACFCHTPKQWGRILVSLSGLIVCLYFFIFSLELLGTGAKVLTGCVAGSLFGENTNPIAALIVGMLVTVLLQSSSTTTSIIVSLVGSGAISVEPGEF
jgi:hypothetical protein